MNIFEKINIIKRAQRILVPFNENLYNTICQENSELAEIINNAFNKCKIVTDAYGDKFLNEVSNDLLHMNVEIKKKEHVIEFFDGEPIFIRNYMYTLRLTAKVNGKEIEFPLEELSYMLPLGFFDADKAPPSMIMFLQQTFCSAIVTHTGWINFVGGYTDSETKFALITYISILQHVMKKLYPECKIEISPISLYNMAFTTKLSCRQIDLFHAADWLREKNVTRMYVPENSDLLTIIPFKNSSPSVIIRMYPTGGIYCAGIRSEQELLACAFFLASILESFTRVNKKFNGINGRKEWDEYILKDRIKQEKNKMRKREKKIAEYNMEKAAKKKKRMEGNDENIQIKRKKIKIT